VYDFAFNQLLSDLDESILQTGVVEHLGAVSVWLILELLSVALIIIRLLVLLELLGLDGIGFGLLISLSFLLLGLYSSFSIGLLLLKSLLLGFSCCLCSRLLALHLFPGCLLLCKDLLLAFLGLGLLLGDSLLLKARPFCLFLNDRGLDVLHCLE
jgi:hypothetical protein